MYIHTNRLKQHIGGQQAASFYDTATPCNTLQLPGTHCNAQVDKAQLAFVTPQHTAIHCNTQVAKGRLAFVTLPDGKKDGKGLLSVCSNPVSLAELFQEESLRVRFLYFSSFVEKWGSLAEKWGSFSEMCFAVVCGWRE